MIFIYFITYLQYIQTLCIVHNYRILYLSRVSELGACYPIVFYQSLLDIIMSLPYFPPPFLLIIRDVFTLTVNTLK